jgi:hypothetical protein
VVVANPNGEAATRRRGAVTSHGPVTRFPTMVARRPTSGLPVMGARQLASDALQWRWLTTCNVIPHGGDDLRCGSRDGVVAGGGRWDLVASGAWRQVPWVEKVVVGLLRSVTWAAMACSWAAVFGADLARTKYRGGFGLPRPLPMQSLAVACGG